MTDSAGKGPSGWAKWSASAKKFAKGFVKLKARQEKFNAGFAERLVGLVFGHSENNDNSHSRKAEFVSVIQVDGEAHRVMHSKQVHQSLSRLSGRGCVSYLFAQGAKIKHAVLSSNARYLHYCFAFDDVSIYAGQARKEVELQLGYDREAQIQLAKQSKKARKVVVTCLGIQQDVSLVSSAGNVDVQNWQLQTPAVIMPQQNCGTILCNIRRWLLPIHRGFAETSRLMGGLCRMYETFSVIDTITVHVVKDALPTNGAVLKHLAAELSLETSSRMSSGKHLRLLVDDCAQHQSALVSKPGIHALTGHASALVRMGNLFGAYSFTERFLAALKAVVERQYKRKPCQTLPEGYGVWAGINHKKMVPTCAK